MNTLTDPNPYSAPADTESTPPRRWMPQVLITLVALILLYRGLLLAQSFYFTYLPQGFPAGSFILSLFVKDAIYGLTALVGSSLLVFRSRPGWYFAVLHWLWYVAYDVVVVACASVFSWIFPLHPGAALLSLRVIVAAFGLAVLFWKPVTEICGVRVPRMRILAILSLATIAFALSLNWLAVSKLW